MLTEDENVVSVQMEMQFRVVDPYRWTFAVESPEQSLSQSLDSAIRYVVGHSTMDDVLTDGREVTRQRVWEELQSIIEPYNMGVSIIDMNFRDARLLSKLKMHLMMPSLRRKTNSASFVKQKLMQGKLSLVQRGQVNRMNEEAQAYKERVTLEAQGEVARFEELLPQYERAPQVTRERITLKLWKRYLAVLAKSWLIAKVATT